MTEETAEAAGEQPATVRSQEFTVDGPIELDISTGSGRVEVVLTEEDAARVDVRHVPGPEGSWADGISSILNWVGEQFPQVADTVQAGRADPAAAVRETRIDMTGGRLLVRAPAKSMPLRGIPLAITVHAPRGSDLTVRSGDADVTISGTAGKVDTASGSGNLTAGDTESATSVRTGAGYVRLGTCAEHLRIRTGSGDVDTGACEGPATITSGSGDVRLGSVSAPTRVRTGNGDVTVTDAMHDYLEIGTGSGEIQVAIRSGVEAEVDLASTGGTVRSDLEVAEQPANERPTLRVRARSGSGNVLITSAGS
ncbi:putative adhesin [Tamaricihabitans halophyticus]|uniref:Putative adhesin n=1 Tax=Tamaricihabitans halophyticus TaxID=1262583 RepID=A0A4R2QNH0_9PSEU|nr:DUF4097 family beta strand repeat-containing protein [Tamaricihabitans halophyticus]TCP50158.1 putative adhesin [Tamaricihabitans halophyticus]